MTGIRTRKSQAEQGFSMIEMLMAAVILAIGILGVVMLQVMTIKATTGTRSLNAGVLLAERVLDQAEALGRNSLLCARTGTAPPLLTPDYFGTAPFTLNFAVDGVSQKTAADFFKVTVSPSSVNAAVPGLGGVALVTIKVEWVDSVTASNVKLTRNVTISRRFSYATS
jgi:prepilin-type N-terminal cleavage/methylation domain-containing protein